MKLKDCTKAELLWVIDHMKRNSFGAIDRSIRNALADLEYKREMDRIDRAKQLADTARKARVEYAELLKPYEGKKLTEIPLDVLEKADEAMSRARDADKKWYRLMGIKM